MPVQMDSGSNHTQEPFWQAPHPNPHRDFINCTTFNFKILSKLKIVSLVPSITELLYTLSLESAVIGITKFCIHPPQWQSSKTKIGGTKNVDIEKIKRLKPDVIIANKEENLQSQIVELATEFKVLLTDVFDMKSALNMILQVGAATGKDLEAATLASNIQSKFDQLPLFHKHSAVYLIWKNPWMTVGHDTYIHHMMNHAGFANEFGDHSRYPEISLEEIQDLQPQCLLLSTEPYPFKEKHLVELASSLPQTHIMLVDGEMFSWYGSRMLEAPAYFQSLANQLVNIP